MEINIFINKFISFEKINNLYELDVRGIKFWHIIRFDIYMEILSQSTSIGEAYITSKKNDFVKRMIFIIKELPFIITKNPFISKHKEILITNSGRRVKNGDIYECLYTDDLVSKLDHSYLLLERTYQGSHMKPIKKCNIAYTDYIDNIYYWKKLLSKIMRIQYLNDTEKIKIIKIIKKINKEFNVKLNTEEWLKKINNIPLAYKVYYENLNKIIKRIEPKVIIQEDSYNMFCYIINEIAKKKGIPTIELQHGTMGKYHIAYNFAEEMNLPGFPDYIFTFGQFWKDVTRFPIGDSKIKVVGWPYYEKKINFHKNIKKPYPEKQILFISQGTIGKELSKVAIELSEKILDGYNIIYKLHPGEYNRWKKDYPWLKSGNISVIDNNKYDMHYYFAQADIQIGVYSTAIFEGLGYGIDTYICRFYGHEYVKELYDNNLATLVDSAYELVELIEGNNQKKNNYETEYFWRTNSLENIKSEIRKIINMRD